MHFSGANGAIGFLENNDVMLEKHLKIKRYSSLTKTSVLVTEEESVCVSECLTICGLSVLAL